MIIRTTDLVEAPRTTTIHPAQQQSKRYSSGPAPAWAVETRYFWCSEGAGQVAVVVVFGAGWSCKNQIQFRRKPQQLRDIFNRHFHGGRLHSKHTQGKGSPTDFLRRRNMMRGDNTALRFSRGRDTFRSSLCCLLHCRDQTCTI